MPRDPLRTENEQEYKPLRFVSPAEWQTSPPAPLEWVIDDWLPKGATTLFYGDGGTGKTLIMQHLLTSVATGKLWAGRRPATGKVLGIFCEDPYGVLYARQKDINAHLGVTLDDTRSMKIVSTIDDDNTMIEFDMNGRPIATDRFLDLVHQAHVERPILITLDVASDFFGGNEIIRRQVNAFVKGQLTRLARAINAAVVLSAHPSQNAIRTGRLDSSASTGWKGAARSTWTLRKLSAEPGEIPDKTKRILARPKANWAEDDEALGLEWKAGVFQFDNRGTGALQKVADAEHARAVFLELLDKIQRSGQHVSDSVHGNYAPRVFSKRGDGRGHALTQFEQAMASLFEEEVIRVEPYGRPSVGTKHIVRTQVDART